MDNSCFRIDDEKFFVDIIMSDKIGFKYKILIVDKKTSKHYEVYYKYNKKLLDVLGSLKKTLKSINDENKGEQNA